jgi:Uma2 family endonuclease
MTIARLMTADELLNSPECGKHCELVKGELVTMRPSGGEHGSITNRATLRLGSFVGTAQAGRVLRR